MTTVPGGEHPGHLLTIFTLLWLVPLLAWRLHARWRRLTARQRISPRRTQIHLSLFTTLLAALAWLWRAQPSVLLHLAGGAVLGLALAWLSWRRTRLEPTRQGIFYQPDRWLGGSVFLFTVSQLGYRMLETLWLSPGLSWAEASARGLTPACLPGIVADAPTGLYAGAGPLSAPTPGGTLTVAFLPIGTAPDLPSRVFLRYCHAHECR